MDTPNMLRGEFYPTHLVQRCHEFKQCPLCKMCENYSKHNHMCVICEDRKRPQRICICTKSQKEAAIKIEAKLKMRLFDPNIRKDKQGVVNIADTSKMDDWDSMVEQLNIQSYEASK